MRRRLAGRRQAVVAATAIADDANVIKVCRNPRSRDVAIVAIVAAAYVRRSFSGGHNAIVTGPTCANHVCMVNNGGRNPGDHTMTILADIG